MAQEKALLSQKALSGWGGERLEHENGVWITKPRKRTKTGVWITKPRKRTKTAKHEKREICNRVELASTESRAVFCSRQNDVGHIFAGFVLRGFRPLSWFRGPNIWVVQTSERSKHLSGPNILAVQTPPTRLTIGAGVVRWKTYMISWLVRVLTSAAGFRYHGFTRGDQAARALAYPGAHRRCRCQQPL